MTQQADEDISPEAFKRLLLEQAWLEKRPEWKTDSEERKVQILMSSHLTLDDAIDAIRDYVACVTKGITPPAGTLASIGSSLRRYMEGAGAMSLDEAFGLKPRQRAGHPLPHRLEREQRSRVAFAMWRLREEATSRNESLSIEAAAGQVINALGLQLSEDTLKKHYIAIDADSMFGAYRDAMIDAGKK